MSKIKSKQINHLSGKATIKKKTATGITSVGSFLKMAAIADGAGAEEFDISGGGITPIHLNEDTTVGVYMGELDLNSASTDDETAAEAEFDDYNRVFCHLLSGEAFTYDTGSAIYQIHGHIFQNTNVSPEVGKEVGIIFAYVDSVGDYQMIPIADLVNAKCNFVQSGDTQFESFYYRYCETVDFENTTPTSICYGYELIDELKISADAHQHVLEQKTVSALTDSSNEPSLKFFTASLASTPSNLVDIKFYINGVKVQTATSATLNWAAGDYTAADTLVGGPIWYDSTNGKIVWDTDNDDYVLEDNDIIDIEYEIDSGTI